MKHTLPILLLSVGTLFCPILRAEETAHSVGIQFGFGEPIFRLNTPTLAGLEKNQLEKTRMDGVKVGLVYEISFYKGLGLFTGLNYTYGTHTDKWQDYQFDVQGQPSKQLLRYQVKTRYDIHQLELALDFQYKFEIAQSTFLTLYSGPTFQYTAKYAAKDFWRYIGTDTEIGRPGDIVSWLYDDATISQFYRKWNITWGVGASFQFRRFFVRGGYDWGLVNPFNIGNFGDAGYPLNNQVGPPPYDDRTTRGRLDQWKVMVGVFLWQSDDER